MRRKFLLLWLIIGVASLTTGTTATPSRPAPSPPAPFTVTIKIPQEPICLHQEFTVELQVINTSHATQSINTMSCDWDANWKSSNAHVTWHRWDCAKNIFLSIKLKPGESYQQTVKMYVSAADSPTQGANFKMGFTPIYGKTTYWSNVAQIPLRSDCNAD